MRELKDRLYTVSTLVPKGARVADIGTDHGHLPIYLINKEISPFCIACDIREKPLLSAKSNIEKTGTEKIELRLGDGLNPVSPDEVDCIVIAGMGGEVISSIIEKADWLKDEKYTLVLQPMTSADALRRYLYENGFEIEREIAVRDAGRIYAVLKVVFSGNALSPDDAFCRIGRLDITEANARLYAEKQLGIVEKCINDLKNADKTENLDTLADTYNKIKASLGGENGT